MVQRPDLHRKFFVIEHDGMGHNIIYKLAHAHKIANTNVIAAEYKNRTLNLLQRTFKSSRRFLLYSTAHYSFCNQLNSIHPISIDFTCP